MAANPPATPILFDRALLRARQNRALRSGTASFLLDRVVEDMAERLDAVVRTFSDAADLWTPGEDVSNMLRDRCRSVTRVGLQDSPTETLPFPPESLDLVVSALAFQFVNDLPGVLTQIRRTPGRSLTN